MMLPAFPVPWLLVPSWALLVTSREPFVVMDTIPALPNAPELTLLNAPLTVSLPASPSNLTQLAALILILPAFPCPKVLVVSTALVTSREPVVMNIFPPLPITLGLSSDPTSLMALLGAPLPVSPSNLTKLVAFMIILPAFEFSEPSSTILELIMAPLSTLRVPVVIFTSPELP